MSHDRRSQRIPPAGTRPPAIDLVPEPVLDVRQRVLRAVCVPLGIENRRGLDVQIDQGGVHVEQLLALRMLPIARRRRSGRIRRRLRRGAAPSRSRRATTRRCVRRGYLRRRGEGEGQAGSAPPAGTWERRRSRRIPRRRTRTWLRRAPTLTIRLRAAKRAPRRAPGVSWRRPPRSRRFPRPCSRRRPLRCAGPRASDRATRTSRRRRALLHRSETPSSASRRGCSAR